MLIRDAPNIDEFVPDDTSTLTIVGLQSSEQDAIPNADVPASISVDNPIAMTPSVSRSSI